MAARLFSIETPFNGSTYITALVFVLSQLMRVDAFIVLVQRSSRVGIALAAY